MWKSTYAYSQELEMQEFAFETRDLDPFADEFEFEGESFVQDARPEDIEQVNWEGLDAEALEEKAFEAEIEGMYEGGEVVAESAEVIAESAEVAEAVAESVEITVEVGVGVAVGGAIAGAVASAAVVIGATLGGMYLLKKYRESKLPEMADDNPFNGSVGYLVLGKIWLPCYLEEVIDTKNGVMAYAFYHDITNFPRYAALKVDDPTLQLLAPIRKWGFADMTPKMIRQGKLIDVPFYSQLPMGSRVKMPSGKLGTVSRGMIFNSDNTDGTYDKYRIKLDGKVDWIYERVFNFEVYDNKYNPKHYAKSSTLKWGPWFKYKPKILYKQKIQKQTYERKARAEAFKQMKKTEKEHSYEYVQKYFDTTRDFKCHVETNAERRRLPTGIQIKKPLIYQSLVNGITYRKQTRKWEARVRTGEGNKTVLIGTYDTEREAVQGQTDAGGYYGARGLTPPETWSPYVGVVFDRRKNLQKPWLAKFSLPKWAWPDPTKRSRESTKVLGTFKTEEEAIAAVLAEKARWEVKEGVQREFAQPKKKKKTKTKVGLMTGVYQEVQSGSWRVRQRSKGEGYQLLPDRFPTEKAAEEALEEAGGYWKFKPAVKGSQSKWRGVTYTPTGATPWHAITKDLMPDGTYRTTPIGSYKTEEEAHQAMKKHRADLAESIRAQAQQLPSLPEEEPPAPPRAGPDPTKVLPPQTHDHPERTRSSSRIAKKPLADYRPQTVDQTGKKLETQVEHWKQLEKERVERERRLARERQQTRERVEREKREKRERQETLPAPPEESFEDLTGCPPPAPPVHNADDALEEPGTVVVGSWQAWFQTRVQQLFTAAEGVLLGYMHTFDSNAEGQKAVQIYNRDGKYLKRLRKRKTSHKYLPSRLDPDKGGCFYGFYVGDIDALIKEEFFGQALGELTVMFRDEIPEKFTADRSFPLSTAFTPVFRKIIEDVYEIKEIYRDAWAETEVGQQIQAVNYAKRIVQLVGPKEFNRQFVGVPLADPTTMGMSRSQMAKRSNPLWLNRGGRRALCDFFLRNVEQLGGWAENVKQARTKSLPEIRHPLEFPYPGLIWACWDEAKVYADSLMRGTRTKWTKESPRHGATTS